MSFREMSAAEIAGGVHGKHGKKFSALEVFEDFLSGAEKDSAIVTLTAEAGKNQARLVDERIARGEPPGLLAGVPVLLSDNICVRGVPTAAGSRALEGWVPPYDAAAWSFLSAEGAVLLGKVRVDEFAPGGTVYAPEPNPASCELRPTYGLVSRRGLIARGSSLEQTGVRAGSAGDVELVLRALARHDPEDSTSFKKNITFTKRTNTLKGRRAAIVKEFMDTPEADVKRAASVLEKAGAELVEISLPTAARFSEACYDVIMASEAFTNFARYDGVRYGAAADAPGTRELFEAARSNFGGETRRLILAGTYLARPEPFDEYYTAAVKTRTLIAEEIKSAFGTVKMDCILQPRSAFKHTRLAGLPSLRFSGFGHDGAELAGPRWGDGELLDIASGIEMGMGR